MTNLYKPRNVLSIVTHYTATGLAAAGVMALASPWAIGASVLVVGGLSAFIIKKQKELMENDLIVHPDIHEHSPRLGEIVRDLYEKSGIKSEKYPVYDFRADRLKINSNNNAINRALSEAFNKMARTPNAAAFHLGKPVIMISEPLLKLLDDEEEKAVLAHEFAHAAAGHIHIGLPQKLVGGLAAAAGSLTLLGAMIGTGIAGVASAIGAHMGSRIAILNGLKDGYLLKADDDDLSLPERVQKKKIKTINTVLGTTLATGVLTWFSPAYLPLFAGLKGLAMSQKFLNSTLSRSFEYQADRGATELGANPLALITALRKITIVNERSKNDAFDGNPPQVGKLTKIWRELHATHPTLERRMNALSDIAVKQGFSAAAINEARTAPIDLPATHNIPRHVIEEMMRVI
ncbi:MAG: M48 family metalloprotease [Alphaproteobacteria bacterium]|nr:M48 family metalloprotease [Alphaproteobacteria bacterium]